MATLIEASSPVHGTSEPLQSSSNLRQDIPVAESWPSRRAFAGDLLTPIEAAQYLRLDEHGEHTPKSAIRTLNYWRSRGELRATRFARRVWYRKAELDRFLERKTEA